MKIKITHVLIVLAIIIIVSLSVYTTLYPSEPSEPWWYAMEDDDPAIGPVDAKVHILEFSDFQCPACTAVHPVVKQVIDFYGDEIRFVFRDFPLSYHENAQLAAEAAGCADEQGKYWGYHDMLFNRGEEWHNITDVDDTFVGYAEELGLDGDRFNQCLKTGTYASEVSKDYEDGVNYQVMATPTFIINGRMMRGDLPKTFEIFQQIIDGELE